MVKYKYTSVVIGNGSVDSSGIRILQKKYDNGWEFVDSAPQMVATGSTGMSRYGPIVFTLKKLVPEITEECLF